MMLNFDRCPLVSLALILVFLEIFAEKFEPRRYAQIQDHHLRRFVEIVSDRSGHRGDVGLEQARPIVGHVDRKRLDGGFLVPRKEIPAHNLICEPALPIKRISTVLVFPSSTALTTNWWYRSLFSGLNTRVSAGLPFSTTVTVPRTSAAPFSVAVRRARNAMIVAWVVPHVPLASFFETR